MSDAPSRDVIVDVIERYVEAVDRKAVDETVALFAPDAVLREPWGIAEYRGHEEIRSFYAKSANAPFRVSLHTPITVLGRYANMMLRVQVEGREPFASADIFEFNTDGTIAMMSAIPDPQATAH
ncbi:nuclear transport factor 2 family protein [Enemella sp. A6]|uniref:nuclear transport factor 2 family protein n=1 Tax=Enemella sp. A6 TaxID=3440152 RepID=UPI003EB9C989